MKKNKLRIIITSILWAIIIILLIFLILRTNKLKHNIEIITWKDLVDITPSKETFNLSLFQESLIASIKNNKESIAWIYATKNIEIIDESGKTQQTNIKSTKILQWNGIVISNDGYILTSQHVVGDLKANYTINLNNKEFNTDKIRYDKWLDIAIIKIKVTEPLIPVKIIDISDNTQIWQIVFALKNDPETQEIITKMWIINSKNQKFKLDKENWNNNIYIWLLQTSTAIEPWFSWWPLININWEVIWINTAIDNIEYWASYSLPITQEFINQTISSIKESSKIIRPYIWIEYKQNTKQNIVGITITKIIKDSPADIAWVKINDIVYGMNNNSINYNNFLYQLYTYKPQKNIILNIQRGEFKQDIQLKIWRHENINKEDNIIK